MEEGDKMYDELWRVIITAFAPILFCIIFLVILKIKEEATITSYMSYCNHPLDTRRYKVGWRLHQLLFILSILEGMVIDLFWKKPQYGEMDILHLIRLIILPMITIISFATLWTLQRDWRKDDKNLAPVKNIDYREFNQLFDIYKHADNLLHQRFNFFMVAESMFAVSFATALVASSETRVVMIAIAVIGMVFTLGWAYVNRRLDFRLIYLSNKYLQFYPVYKKYLGSVPRFSIDSGTFLTWILPTIMFFFWYFLSLITYRELFIFQ